MIELLAQRHLDQTLGCCDFALTYAKVLRIPENLSVNLMEKLGSNYKAVASVLLPDPLVTN